MFRLNRISLVFLTALISLPVTAWAKDPCRVLKSKADAFEGQERVMHTWRGSYEHIYVYDRAGKVTLSVTFFEQGERLTVVPTGTMLKVAIEGGGLLNLPTVRDEAPTIIDVPATDSSTTPGKYSRWEIEVALTKEDVVALVKKPTAFRLADLGTGQTLNLSLAEQNDIVLAATCLSGATE